MLLQPLQLPLRTEHPVHHRLQELRQLLSPRESLWRHELVEWLLLSLQEEWVVRQHLTLEWEPVVD